MALIPGHQVAVRNHNCSQCGFCENCIECASKKDACIGCGACIAACPQSARSFKTKTADKSAVRAQNNRFIEFVLDGKPQRVSGPLSVSKAIRQLENEGPASGQEPGEKKWKSSKAACSTGGCWNCAVLIDGILARSCITALRPGMHIATNRKVIDRAVPKRVATVMRPAPHHNPSIFTHGCNYRCDLCHNWDMAFSSTAKALTPAQTVSKLGLQPEKDRWIGISGGEPTLNRYWLVETVRELRRTAPKSRIQLDTNASLLTHDYIDELISAGITDISPDLKAFRTETFMKISGIRDRVSAQQYMQTAWQAIVHLINNYGERVFTAVSIPCHPRIHTRTELEEMAAALVSLNPEIPVTLTELQPAFRKRDWPFLNRQIMEEASQFLAEAGLKRVIIQGGAGIPRAVDPGDLVLGSEDF